MLPPEFKDNPTVFLEMLEELDSALDGYMERINVAKYEVNRLNKDVRPVHSALYQAGPSARESTAAESGQIITQKVIEQASTK